MLNCSLRSVCSPRGLTFFFPPPGASAGGSLRSASLAWFAMLAACSESPPDNLADAGLDSGMDAATSVCAQAETTLTACELDFPGSISDPAIIAACMDEGLLRFVACVNMFPVEACSDEPTNAFTDCLFGP